MNASVNQSTLQTISNSVHAFLPTLAAWTISACLTELPAATAFAVARVMPLVDRMSSSGVAVRSGSEFVCRICGNKEENNSDNL